MMPLNRREKCGRDTAVCAVVRMQAWVNYNKKLEELIILRLQKIISKNYQRHLTAPCQRPLQLQLLGILSVGVARI